ncbi:hypothetical protein ACFE04_015488 [Oxalis oulophora]
MEQFCFSRMKGLVQQILHRILMLRNQRAFLQSLPPTFLVMAVELLFGINGLNRSCSGISPLPFSIRDSSSILSFPMDIPGLHNSPIAYNAFQGASSESGSGYLVPVGSFSPGNLFGNTSSSPLPSPIAHPPQPVGILGSYDQSVAQTALEDAGTDVETQPLIVLEVALARMQGFQPWDYQKQDSSTDSFDIPYNLEAKSINPNSILV